jgi:hypothetical protein
MEALVQCGSLSAAMEALDSVDRREKPWKGGPWLQVRVWEEF